MSEVRGRGQEEQPHVQGQGRRPGGATPRLRSGAVAERSNPASKEPQPCRHRRAESSYSMFKVRRDGCDKTPLLQGKEQWLRFHVQGKKTQDGRCWERASEGRHTETIITEN